MRERKTNRLTDGQIYMCACEYLTAMCRILNNIFKENEAYFSK